MFVRLFSVGDQAGLHFLDNIDTLFDATHCKNSVSRQAEVKTHLPAFGVLFNTHTFPRPFITEILLMGRKEPNQTNKHILFCYNWQSFLD